MTDNMESVVMRAIADHPGAFRLDLQEFFTNPLHWVLWGTFVYEANNVWSIQNNAFLMGFRKKAPHYSARTIGEVIRHHTNLVDATSEFKVNDWLWPDFGRLYMLVYPDRCGFFETRRRAAA